MSNEREVEFRPDPNSNVDFKPSAGLESGSGQGGGTVEQAKDKAQQLVGQAQEKAGQKIEGALASQKERAAGALTGVAQSLRGAGQQFQGQVPGASQYIGQAADEVERLAHYLRTAEVGELVDSVENLARRQPAAFLGGAFVLGVLGARFLKSSRSTLAQQRISDRELSSRVRDPEMDAVSRPTAPGYAPPQERATADRHGAGPYER